MVRHHRNRHNELGPMDSASNSGHAQALRRSRRRAEPAPHPGHARKTPGKLRQARAADPHLEATRNARLLTYQTATLTMTTWVHGFPLGEPDRHRQRARPVIVKGQQGEPWNT